MGHHSLKVTVINVGIGSQHTATCALLSSLTAFLAGAFEIALEHPQGTLKLRVGTSDENQEPRDLQDSEGAPFDALKSHPSRLTFCHFSSVLFSNANISGNFNIVNSQNN